MQDFFHVAQELRVGEIVAPGRWGRETLAYGTRSRRGIREESDAVNLIWEGALEAARLARFPEAVSRLDCVFAWFREEEARVFRDRFRPDHKIYRVELIEPETPVTIADYGAITQAEAGPYVEVAARMAIPYWNPIQPRFPEALIGGAVRNGGMSLICAGAALHQMNYRVPLLNQFCRRAGRNEPHLMGTRMDCHGKKPLTMF